MAKKTVKKTKEEKPEAGVLQINKLVTPAEAKQLMRFPYASPVSIPDPDLLIEECEREIEFMSTMRTELGLVEKWQKARDQYAGVTEFTDFPWDNCCFSKDTEVLTNRGWVLISDAGIKDKVYSVSPLGFAEYMPIIAKQKVFIEDVISFKSKSIDLKVSRNHFMYVQDRYTGAYNFIRAEHLLKISGEHLGIPLTSIWCGKQVDKIYGFDAQDWMSFLGWYISEGWTHSGGTIGIAQSKTANPDKCKIIESLLCRMGIKYTARKNGFQYLVSCKKFPIEARKELKGLGLCHQKYIPRKYLDLDKKYLVCLLESLISGDGCIIARYDRQDKIRYYTTSKLLADNIQELVQKIGLRARIITKENNGKDNGGYIRGQKVTSILTGYTVNINSKVRAKVQSLKRKIEKYNDNVFCVTTPYHTLYVRRNGIAQWCGNSNLFIHITSTAVDILNTKAQAQMFVSPMMVLRPLPGQTGEKLYEDVSLKEKFIDYKIQEEIEIEEKLDPVLQDAINIGTGIAKVIYLKKVDYDATVSEMYESTEKDIRNFKIDFKKDKGTPEYNRILKDLIGAGTEEKPVGIAAEVWMHSDEVTYNNPQVSYVKLDDLMVRPDIDDIDNQRVIAENTRFTWLELLNHVNTNYFLNSGPDALGNKALAILREKYKGNNEYARKVYEAREVICYYDYEENNKPKRVVITYLTEEKILLRAITFPYSHRLPYYVFYYIKKVPGSIYGEGFAERLEDTNKGMNDMWNQAVNAGTLRNAPSFKAKTTATLTPNIKVYGPARIWWMADIRDVEAFPIYGQSAEVINMITKLERYGEWQTGVSAYASGRESPSDPNAPASKSYMLLKESNLRLNKCIRQLHKGNKRLFYMIDKLIYQHTKQDKVPFMVTKGDKIKMVPISKKLLGMKVEYCPQLTDSVTKELQKEQDRNFGSYLMPILMNVPSAPRTIMEIQIRNMGGAWVQAMDKLLPEGWTPAAPTPPGGGAGAGGAGGAGAGA